MLQKVKKIPGSVPFSESTPKVNGVCSGLTPILRPSFWKICPVVFVLFCCQTNQQTHEYFLLHRATIAALQEVFYKWIRMSSYQNLNIQRWKYAIAFQRPCNRCVPVLEACPGLLSQSWSCPLLPDFNYYFYSRLILWCVSTSACTCTIEFH